MAPDTVMNLAEKIKEIGRQLSVADNSCCERANETFGKIHSINCTEHREDLN